MHRTKLVLLRYVYEESVQTSWNNRNSIEYTMFKYKYYIYIGDNFLYF